MKALVFGRGRGVWDEMAAAQKLAAFDCIIGVGSAAVDYSGPLDHWVSFHHSVFPEWAAARSRKGLPPARVYWSSVYRGSQSVRLGAAYPVRFVRQEGGSSGLIAVMVAFELGAHRVVLAGVPMDGDYGQYDTKLPWKEALIHREIWRRDLHKLLGRVRSMSGWTQEQLGTPTTEWLLENDCTAV